MNGFDAQITFCYTKDMEGTARFYEGIVGLPLAPDQGTCRIYRAARDAYLGFCECQDAIRPDGIILTLVTDDVDGWHRRLIGQGGRCEKAPVFTPRTRSISAFFGIPMAT